MNVLVVLAHPSESSLNHAIAYKVRDVLMKNNHKVLFHDLYSEKFDPLLKFNEMSKDSMVDMVARKHCEDLINADGIIIIHPNWWGMPPAIMKGWIDRIIRPGVAYRFVEGDNGEGVPVGLLKAKIAIVINTSDTEENREMKVFGDPLGLIWKNCIFGLCGINNFVRKVFRIVVNSSIEMRSQWIEETESLIGHYFPLE